MRCCGGGDSKAARGLLSSLLPSKRRGPHQTTNSPLGKDLRLRKPADFQRVWREGRSWAKPLAVLWVRPNGTDTSRVGFSVSRRVGKAVVRNRVKRRLRELVRRMQLPEGWDMVFIARAPAASATFAELRCAVEDVTGRARVAQALFASRKVVQ